MLPGESRPSPPAWPSRTHTPGKWTRHWLQKLRKHGDPVAGGEELLADHATDVSGPSNDQEMDHLSLLTPWWQGCSPIVPAPPFPLTPAGASDSLNCKRSGVPCRICDLRVRRPTLFSSRKTSRLGVLPGVKNDAWRGTFFVGAEAVRAEAGGEPMRSRQARAISEMPHAAAGHSHTTSLLCHRPPPCSNPPVHRCSSPRMATA